LEEPGINHTVSNSAPNSESRFRPAQQLCRKILARIPTHFGRLVYVASLRDPNTGKYVHETVTQLLGLEDADRMLCHLHHKVFSEWLNFGLAEQKADLDAYFSSAGRVLSLEECRAFTPPGIRDMEQRLYLTDLELILELRRFAPSDPSGSPDL
jgi:hypothetical protein